MPTRRPFFLAIAVLLGVQPLLPAQSSTVLPKGYKTQEGNAVEGRPFAFDRCRLSQYFGFSMLQGQLPRGASLIEIAYRRDGRSIPSQAMSRSTTPVWQIRAGNLLKTSIFSEDNAFLGPGNGAGGRGNKPDTLKIVFRAKKVSFPKLQASSSGLPSFSLRFKFDSPLSYVGGGLAIDHYVYENRNRSHIYYVDAVRSKADKGKAVAFGSSCPKGSNRAYGIPSYPGGDPVQLLLLGGPQKQTVVLGLIGVSKKTWASLTLPYSLAKAGLPGCSIYCSGEIALPVQSFSNGSAKIQFPIPAVPNFASLTWYAQFVVADSRVNAAFPFALSNGIEFQNGKSLPAGSGLEASFLYGVGNLAKARYGLRDYGISLVTELVYR